MGERELHHVRERVLHHVLERELHHVHERELHHVWRQREYCLPVLYSGPWGT